METIDKPILIDPSEALSERYAIRRAGKGSTLESCLPRVVVEREARRKGMSVEDFLKSYEAEYLYNSFGGMHVRFVERKKKSEHEPECTVEDTK